MNSKQVYFKTRQTILEMFKDRGYKGPYVEASNMSASEFYKQEITSDGTLNEIDLSGFYEERVFPGENESNTLQIPIYVHFTTFKKPIMSKKVREDFYDNLLENQNVSEKIKRLRESFKSENKEFTKKLTKDIVALLWLHILVVYDGWDYAQNKEQNDLMSTYMSTDREPVIYDLEIWPVHTLVVNYTQHMLVPKHYLLSLDEKSEFLSDQAKFYLNETDRVKYEAMNTDTDKLRYMDNYMFQVMPKIGMNDPINLYYHGRLRQIYKIVRNGKSPTYRMVRKNPLLKDSTK